MLAFLSRLGAIVAVVAMLGSIDGCLPSRDSTNPVQSGELNGDTGTDSMSNDGMGNDGMGTDSADSTGPAGTGTVVSITDGDTLRLNVDGAELRVRLIGIDTPEVYPDTQCFGPEAETALAALAPTGSTIGYAYDRDPRDQYDRELMYLFAADGTSINLALVAQGYAVAVLFEPNDLYWNDLQAAEQAARDAALGLWGQC